MKHLTMVVLISLFLAFPVFANTEYVSTFSVSAICENADSVSAITGQGDFCELDLLIPAFSSVVFFAAAVPGEEEPQIPEGIRNNEFFLECLRLTKLAQQTFEFGDYDASEGFAQEAIRFAALSNEYVSTQLIAEAKRLLDWADANNIVAHFPGAYNESKEYYETSVVAHSNEEWNESINASIRSIEILAALESNRTVPLPRQYTVRTWANERDCLWNIAGYSWVYGDPWRWRDLYNANRSRMPDPNNPDLIEPGFVLEIPSIRGEVRQGMWDPNANYGQ